MDIFRTPREVRSRGKRPTPKERVANEMPNQNGHLKEAQDCVPRPRARPLNRILQLKGPLALAGCVRASSADK